MRLGMRLNIMYGRLLYISRANMCFVYLEDEAFGLLDKPSHIFLVCFSSKHG